MNDTIER